VRCGKADTNIKGIDAQEFPIVPTFDPEGAIYVNADVLRTMIAKTVFAAATDESRPMLTGVLMRMNGDRITLYASDGFRLSVCNGTLAKSLPEARQALIPAKALAEVGRILSDQQEPVAISITPVRGQVLFHLDNVDVVSQLIDQKYPEVEALIPKKQETTTVVNTADLLKACKQASIFARDASDVVRFRIIPSEDGELGKVDIAARADEKGDNLNELDASISGSGLEIGFNVKFLIDVLSVLDTPQLSLGTNTPKSPGLFVGLGDSTFQHIIMPINLPKTA
jgi:DNA polymerase-3 subunit beta